MVGKFFPPEQSYQEPTEDIGFSCGLGYAKADALYFFFYINDRTEVMSIGGYTSGGVAAAATLLTLCFWFTGAGGDEDDYLEYEDEYGAGGGYGANYNPAAVREAQVVPQAADEDEVKV